MADEVVVAVPAAPAPSAPAETVVATVETPAGAAPADGEKPVEAPAEKPPEKVGQSRFERKISRLHREAAEQKARADFLEAKLKESAPKAPADETAPRLENFSNIEEYATAKAKHETAKAFKEHEAKQREESGHARQKQLQSGWEERAAKAESKYEDFDDVVGDIKPTTPWAVAIMKAENGDDVAYHLGKNMAEARRIAALDPVDQFLEIGRLSATLKLQPPKPREVSKAPEPISPVSGTRATTTKGSEDASNYKEFLRLRNRELGRVKA